MIVDRKREWAIYKSPALPEMLDDERKRADLAEMCRRNTYRMPEHDVTCTDAEVTLAIKLGASDSAIYKMHAGATVGVLIDRHADWLLKRAAKHLSPSRLDACANIAPREALKYVAARLTPERLDACAEAEPQAALKYVAANLTPERLDMCAAAQPQAALQYAAKHLTPGRLDACAKAVPFEAIVYAAKHLTIERLEACAASLPRSALQCVTPRLALARFVARIKAVFSLF